MGLDHGPGWLQQEKLSTPGACVIGSPEPPSCLLASSSLCPTHPHPPSPLPDSRFLSSSSPHAAPVLLPIFAESISLLAHFRPTEMTHRKYLEGIRPSFLLGTAEGVHGDHVHPG